MRGRADRAKNPFFINMEILPDVKSLEDILVHSLAGWFKHAPPADVKYLGCFTCYKAACPHNNTDTECGHCGHGLFELTSGQNRKSGGEASGEIQIPIKPLSRKCATASVAQFYSH